MTVCDDEGTVLKFFPARTFQLNLEEGGKVGTGGSMEECLKTRKPVFKTLSKDVYGFAIKSISIPVFEAGELTGIAAIGISFLRANRLYKNQLNLLQQLPKKLPPLLRNLRRQPSHYPNVLITYWKAANPSLKRSIKQTTFFVLLATWRPIPTCWN